MNDTKPKLLIVDDDENIRGQMKWALVDEYQVFLAQDRLTALELLTREQIPLVCLDLGLPPHPAGVEEGFATLDAILRADPLARVVVVTGQGDRSNALLAVSRGAADFFSKPIETEILKTVLDRARHIYDLESENRRLRTTRSQQQFSGMLGNSPGMQDVFTTIRKVARSDASVLVIGESGTGKELTARAVHDLSRRAEGPFVPINCGAIPENLLESELFGHEKGAFTGAHTQRPGQVESAHQGTLFLDEIGELPLPLQVKMLRFLQDGQVQRVGGRKLLNVEARIIAATNANLERSLAEGTFREDLYYRLAVVVIKLPPLRERGEDIPLLAQAFLQRYADENRRRVKGFAADALRAFKEYAWPGNVRELENRIRRAVIMADGTRITLADLGLDRSYARFSSMSLREAREALEKELVEAALGRCEGNMSKAADELGVSRPTLYELIEKLGIRRD